MDRDQDAPPPTLPAPASPAAEPSPPSRAARGGRAFREILETALLAAILYLGVRTVILPYEVEGASMTPNLQDHERVLVNRVAYFSFDANRLLDLVPGVDREGQDIIRPFGGPERGDVVVLEPPSRANSNKPYIKRVIGLPGETVTFEDGYVEIDGVRLDEDYIAGPITECATSSTYCEVGTIPDGHVFVLGDNRENSSDSRAFGLVPIDQIEGRAFFANWPLDALGPIGHGDY